MTSQQSLTAALLLLITLYAAQTLAAPTPVPPIPTVTLPHVGVPFGPSEDSLERCVAYDEFVSNAVMTYAVSYLGDNTAENAEPISAKDLTPFTPAQLFDQLYQGEASSINFKKTLITLKYAGSCDPKEVWSDREQLRRNVYTYAKAESYAIARSAFGELMLLVASDFVPTESQDWIRFRCMPQNSVDLAQTAISIELSRLRNEIGEARFGSFLDLTSGTTLAFAIDDTGSMSGEIKAAKQRVELITDQLKNSINRPHEYVLVPFNDPFIYDITHTRDSEEFKKALRRLYAHGGGDAPEMCLTGIKWAIQKSRPGSTIYVITDNDAKDYKLQNLVVAQAQHKQISIVFLLTDELKVCGMDFYYHGDQLICRKLYEYIAEKTGGKVMVVRKDQIFRATEVIKTGLVQGLVPVKIETLFARKKDAYGFPFPVDPSIKELVIEASGSCGSLQFQNHNQKSTQIEKYGQTLSTSVLVKGGQYGQWRVSGANYTKRVSCETEVSARTSFGFVVTTFVKKLSQQNKYYKILNGQPTNQDSVAFYLDFYGEQNLNTQTGDRIIKIRFVNDLGDDVMPPHMVSQNNHHGDVTEKIHFENGLPAGLDPFYLVAEGRLGGVRFSRYSTYRFATTSMEISTNIADVTIRPGLESEFTCSVTNRGSKQIKVAFDVSAKTGRISYEEDFTPTILVGKTRQIPIKINLDSNVQVGTSVKITISTKDVDSESSQYHVIEAIVGQNERPKMESLQIHTMITTRFAETKVTMKVRNDKKVAREAEVEIMLPGEAFIMNLTMMVGDEVMVGSVEEKLKAKRIYDKAKSKNLGAGHVAVRDKSSQVYKTKLLVPPFQTATFELSYQQLLRRKHGSYEYMVFLNPKQPVRDLRVDVHIQEEGELNFVRVPGYQSKRTYRNIRNKNKILSKYPSATSDISYSEDRRKCHVLYAPTLSAQAAHSPLGLSGTFTVQFDVERRQVFGESFVSDGFFTHFFSAPSYVVAPPKMVTFVIDTSSSMLGHKLKQVKLALKETLKSFDSQDYVNLVLMNDEPRPVFDDVMMQATPGNLQSAMQIIEGLEAEGGTNFELAFDVAFDNLMPYITSLDNAVYMDDPGTGAIITPVEGTYDRHAKMIVFLTDGKPTVGQTDTNEILRNIHLLNVERVNVHSIGFGNLADMGFLDKLALENGGMAKRIFEDLDAAAQIKNFFGDVIRPLMSDVSVEFEKGKVRDVTIQHFDNIYEGKEIIVSGRFTNKQSKSKTVKTKVTGKTATDYIEFDFEIDQSKKPKHLPMTTHKLELFSENMWAYLQIKDLLDQSVVMDDPEVKKEIEESALHLSLAHNFVTPLTSMVVTRDEDRATIDKELLIEDELIEEEIAEEDLEEEAPEEDVFSRTLGIDELVGGSELTTAEKESLGELYGELYGAGGSDIDLDSYDGLGEALIVPTMTTYEALHVLTATPSFETDFIGDRLVGDDGFDGGWLYGDPHFVIPMNDDFNLCFTWDGQSDEVYNILYDYDRDISINAVMEEAHEFDFDQTGTFVSAISFVLKRKNFIIIVHPNNVTLERYDQTRKSTTFPVYYSFTEYIGNGIVLRVSDVQPSSAKVKITIDDMDFQVVLRRDWKHYTTHLDFSIGRDVAELINEHYDGLIGQFVNSDLKVDEPEIVNATFTTTHVVINGKSGNLTEWHARNPSISMKTLIPCWTTEFEEDPIELIHFSHETYLVDSLLATPKYPNAL